MKVGDLVVVRQDIQEYVAERGMTPGVVLGVLSPATSPILALIQWPDGETENLYADELEILSV